MVWGVRGQSRMLVGCDKVEGEREGKMSDSAHSQQEQGRGQ